MYEHLVKIKLPPGREWFSAKEIREMMKMMAQAVRVLDKQKGKK